MGNDSKKLHKAKNAKNDEFYTLYESIEREVKNYPGKFKDKWIYCPCDDFDCNGLYSNFVKYFKNNFAELGLKHLTATHIHMDGTSSERYDYDGMNEVITMLSGNGDFRSDECTRIKNDCDVIVTNPPFSLFRDFIGWLNDDSCKMKSFLIIGNAISMTCEEIFPLVVENKMWIGVSPRSMNFNTDNGMSTINACWFTNIEHEKRQVKIPLIKTYCGHESEYPAYDGYNAIEVSKVKDIPNDYYGLIGVPVTYLCKHNPSQFDLIGKLNHNRPESYDFAVPKINGHSVYTRLLIRRKVDDCSTWNN